MSAGEVEPWIWKAAVAATKRYFRGVMANSTIAEHICYRTGYIMGYRAGVRLGKRRAVNGEGDRCVQAGSDALTAHRITHPYDAHE